MNKEIIEKYIQFGIDNWWGNAIMSDLKIKKQIKPSHRFLERRLKINISYIWDDDIRKEFIINSDNLYKYIMKKEFIEAVARWLYIWNNSVRVKIDSVFNKLIDEITFEQALAIRDGQLEFFIKDLIL